MAVKLADTLAPMGDFPVAEAGNVSIDINGTTKDLQTAYEDGDLGAGGSSIQVDQMPLASAANLGKVLQYIGASGTYQQNYFYACVSDGEATPTYSWIQVNVQPSNAQASQISYDNTTSGLTADDAQEAIDEIATGLGTASAKDFTDTVRPNSHDLVESGSVYSAINNALESIYTPRGDLSCAELTSALLIADNVGSVYQMSDSGTTSALFINGAGITISAGDNVGIIKAGADTYMFNYMGNAFDLTDYQKKDLTTAVEGATTVEGALSALSSSKVSTALVPSDASASNKLLAQSSIANDGTKIFALKGYSTTDAIDLNTLKRTGVYSVTSQLASNLPDPSFLAWWQIIVINKSTTNTGYCSQIAMARNNSIYMRDCENDVWSSWQKLITESDNGCFTFTIGANQTATITLGAAYVSLFASLQVQGAGSRMFCLEYNNTSLYGKTIRSGNEYEAERGVSTFTFLGLLTFANSASRQMTITNSGSETETITIMGNVVNVTVS